jgi:hypothetical protein
VFSGCRVNLQDQKQVPEKEIGVDEPKVMDKADGEGFQQQIFQELTNCNIISLIINTSEDHSNRIMSSVFYCFKAISQPK